jgi:hypothetical protein
MPAEFIQSRARRPFIAFTHVFRGFSAQVGFFLGFCGERLLRATRSTLRTDLEAPPTASRQRRLQPIVVT